MNSTDPILKDSWRLEGSQDKKDWRRTTPDVDISRRWREEERETSLLGRRDRRKEDRRLENTSTSENRSLPSDRWHESRGSGHDSRRENKWSSRWGPEDKEKDSRSEKRNDVEKEDGHTEKQSSGVGNRIGSDRDTDSRDKWRPRHRLEAQAAGVATYRAAPGFGLEKGRTEGSNVRFSPGRGRANINGNLQIVRSPIGSSLGSALVDKNKTILGKSSLGADSYYYPRGKLLDIYRKQKVDPNFDSLPSEMEHTSPLTQHGSIEPLAFVAPAAEEEVCEMQKMEKDFHHGLLMCFNFLYSGRVIFFVALILILPFASFRLSLKKYGKEKLLAVKSLATPLEEGMEGQMMTFQVTLCMDLFVPVK